MGKTVVSQQVTATMDDSLLPPAEELAKLKEVDPDIVNWIKQRTEIEQNARIKFNEDRMKLANKELTGRNGVNYLAIFCITFIVIIFMCFAFYLI